MAFGEHIVITAITILVASSGVLYAYVKRKIDTSAFIGAVTLGLLILLLFGLEFGYVGVLALFTFFLFGNLVTRYKYDKKLELGVAEGNKGMRDINNVLGNGLSPLIFAVLYAVSSQNQSTLFLLGFSGSVTTACADTFSTEIGQAEGEPRLITTLERVPVGTSGGVSLPGFGAALLGSSLVSLVCLAFVSSDLGMQTRITFFIVCLLAGFSGCVIDSLLGATVEDRNPLRLNKHHVNILATLSGGIIAILLGRSFGIQI
ncbi:MAG: DUF92 domain-containing protein [Candidatus Methanospirareceae archaeon]